MLSKITSIFTTAAPVGVAIRDVILSLGVVIAMFGALGLLTPEQVEQLKAYLAAVSDPAVLTAFGVLIGAAISVYRVVTKSSSDKAAEAAKQIDAKIPVADPVVIQTPGKQPDIKIDVKADGTPKK